MAAAVKEKKEEVSKTTLKPATKREKITSFISQKKSRQEFLPLVGKFIDRAKAEPLHLKNNAWQQWNSSVLMYSLSRSHLGECESISDVSPNSCFGKYYHTIRFNVKTTSLAKKIRKWFAGDRTKNKPLEYRFTGKESRLFCHNFMYIVESLKTDEDQNVHTFKLHVFAYTGLNLRDSVSLFSRISMSSEQVQSLSQVCSNYFRATGLFLKSTPTSWTIGHVVPVHAQQLQETLGLGLGINTRREGRQSMLLLPNLPTMPSITTDGVRFLSMSTFHYSGYEKMGVMKLCTNTLQMCIYLRGVSPMTFVTVVSPKMVM